MKHYKITVKIEAIVKDGEHAYKKEETAEFNERRMFKLLGLWDFLKDR